MKTDFSEVHIPDRFGGEGIGHHVAMIRLRDDPPKILIQSPKTHTFPGDKQRFWNGSKLYESDIVDSVVNSLTHESLHSSSTPNTPYRQASPSTTTTYTTHAKPPHASTRTQSKRRPSRDSSRGRGCPCSPALPCLRPRSTHRARPRKIHG